MVGQDSFVEKFKRDLDDSGWRVKSKQLKKGVYILFATKKEGTDEISIVSMAITSDEDNFGIGHLKRLYDVARKRNASTAILILDVDTTDQIVDLANQNNIKVVDADLIRNYSSSDSTTPKDARKSLSERLEQVVSAKDSAISRRNLVSAGAILVLGSILAVGSSRNSNQTTDSADQTYNTISYRKLQSNTTNYRDSSIYYSPAKIVQVSSSDEATGQYRIQVIKNEDTWEGDLLGSWSGERFYPGDVVEFWGTVIGTFSYETRLGTKQTIPTVRIDDMQRYSLN